MYNTIQTRQIFAPAFFPYQMTNLEGKNLVLHDSLCP